MVSEARNKRRKWGGTIQWEEPLDVLWDGLGLGVIADFLAWCPLQLVLEVRSGNAIIKEEHRLNVFDVAPAFHCEKESQLRNRQVQGNSTVNSTN